MPLEVGATFKLSLELNEKGTAIQGNTPGWQGNISLLESLAFGTIGGAFDLAYMAERTVASATNDDLDLNAVLTDALGQTLTMVELVGLIVVNKPRLSTDPANTTNLTIGVGSNPIVGFLGGTTPTIGPLRPGASICLWAGSHATGLGAITAATADILRIANSSGASAKYQIAALGRSA